VFFLEKHTFPYEKRTPHALRCDAACRAPP